jgi:hypothetical protein
MEEHHAGDRRGRDRGIPVSREPGRLVKFVRAAADAVLDHLDPAGTEEEQPENGQQGQWGTAPAPVPPAPESADPWL